MTPPPLRVRVVLVHPRNPLNIGAAARAMANFGLEDLVVVEPYEAGWREARSAVGAAGVLRRGRELGLREALADCRLILGTTAGRRRELRQTLVPLPALSGFVEDRLPGSGDRMALLFGSEKTGLRNSDLEHCHALLSIPTSPEAPSMNLGQAVAVALYELSRGRPQIAPPPRISPLPPPPTKEQLECLLEQALKAFARLGYMKDLPPKARAEKLRRALLRWNMARPDAALLQGFLKRVVEGTLLPLDGGGKGGGAI